MSELIVSLDTVNDFEAMGIVDELGDVVEYYKIGSVLFNKYHTDILHMLQLRGKKVLLDLKLFDVAFNIEETCKFLSKIKGLFAISVCHYSDIVQSAKKGVAGTDIKVFTTPALKCEPSGSILTSEEPIHNGCDADGIIVDNSIINNYVNKNIPLINVGITDVDQIESTCDYNIVGKLISKSDNKVETLNKVLERL